MLAGGEITGGKKDTFSTSKHQPEITHVVEATGSICGPHDLQTESRLQVSDLQQHQRQVLNEQQRIHQRSRISHNPPVVRFPGLQHPHPVEEPIRRHEEEDQGQQQTAKDEEAWKSGSERAEEQRPGGDEEDEELKGQRNVKSLTRRAARLQRIPPQELWEHQEGQRGDQSKEPQHSA